MQLYIPAYAKDRRRYDAVPSELIKKGLDDRLEVASRKLAETQRAFQADHSKEGAYNRAVIELGSLAIAKDEFLGQPRNGTMREPASWLEVARDSLQAYAQTHPGDREVLSSKFFSQSLSDREALNRDVNSTIQEEPRMLTGVQFAAAFAIGAVELID